MSSKSTRHRHNQAAESRLMDESLIEQRAAQIARDEGRDLPTAEDRARAREELLAPNETLGDPEVSPELGRDITAWDEAPESSGKRVERVMPEDEASIGKELAEKGMKGPCRTRNGEDPLWRS
jgi:hypothetical protein